MSYEVCSKFHTKEAQAASWSEQRGGNFFEKGSIQIFEDRTPLPLQNTFQTLCARVWVKLDLVSCLYIRGISPHRR